MQQRNYAIDEKTPDLLIKYYVEMNAETKRSSQPMPRQRPTLNSSDGWKPRYYLMRTPVIVSRGNRITTTPQEGVLSIDIIERTTSRLIWHGWSGEPLQNQAEFTTALAENIHDLMKAYPIQIR